jgi:chloramphenicol O-acetyltransferase type A
MAGAWLDLETWERRSQFQFFRVYDQPFFNICTEVDVSRLHERARAPGGPSFFLATLHLSLRAANHIPELRMRIRGERVWTHDRIHAGSTILREDETFAFAYFDFEPRFARFEMLGREVIDRARRSRGALDPQDDRDDLIHYSVLPWIHFTSFSHARRWHREDSVPKIVFGKHSERDGARWMPVSIEVHHALLDGIHVARFLEQFQNALREADL